MEFKRDCVSRGLSEPTIFNYEDSFKRFFKFLGEPTVVKSVTDDTVKSYIEHLLQREIKETSINHYLRDLRAFLYYLMDKKEIPAFKIKQMKAQEEAPDPYTVEQLKVLTQEPAKNDSFVKWRTWAIIYWILDTGNRAKTVCNIKMKDLEGRQVKLTHTKNKKAQVIQLSLQLMPLLGKYIRKFRSDATDEDYLFPSIYGGQLTPDALKQSVRAYNHRCGIDKTGVHDFRKTYTTMALASGNTTEQEVADRLGHGNTALLKKYAQFTQAQKIKFHDASTPLNELNGMIQKRIKARA